MLSQNKIIGGTEVRILSYLRKNLEEKASLRQIATMAPLSYNSCYKSALQLEKEGVLAIERKSGVNYCSLRSSAKTYLLVGYVSLLEAEKVLSPLAILKKIVEEIIFKHREIDCLVLFGSYAKGKAQEKSDIDLFCVGNDSKAITAFARHLSLKYSKEIQMVVGNKEEFREMLLAKKVNVGTEVRDTGIILYGYEFFWRMVLGSR